jgi:hypothetical protein
MRQRQMMIGAKDEEKDEKMRLGDAGRAGLPMVDLEHPRAFGLSEIPL